MVLNTLSPQCKQGHKVLISYFNVTVQLIMSCINTYYFMTLYGSDTSQKVLHEGNMLQSFLTHPSFFYHTAFIFLYEKDRWGRWIVFAAWIPPARLYTTPCVKTVSVYGL